MSFDCSKHNCKSKCCKVVPINDIFYRANEDKRTRSVIKEESHREGFITPITVGLKCCYLKDDGECNIYDDRPNVCKVFGDDSHILMSCDFQDKDGNKRSRQAKRRIERDKKKEQDGTFERMKQKTYGAMKTKSLINNLKLKADGNK